MQELTPLQRYLLQRRLAGGGVGPGGQGGLPPSLQGADVAPLHEIPSELLTPEGGDDQFILEKLKKTKPYLGGY